MEPEQNSLPQIKIIYSISTISNIFPLYKFQDADTFGRRLVTLLSIYKASNTRIIKLRKS